MLTRCDDCQRRYDDAVCWTICPHGPLWARPDTYCPEHDLVHCPHVHHRSDQPKVLGDDGRWGLLTTYDAMVLRERAGKRVVVTLDGVPVTDRSVCADDRQGWVLMHSTEPPTVDWEHDDVFRELVTGDVTITTKELSDAD